MLLRPIFAIPGLLPLFAFPALSQLASTPNQKFAVHLSVDAGTPLRLYITRRVSYRFGEPVEAKLIQPVWAYDRIVIPAGATVEGRVAELDPIPKMLRARAIVGGDFTPLKRAKVSFTSLTLPDRRTLPLQTEECSGLATIYVEPRRPKKPKKQKAGTGKSSRMRQFLLRQAENQANARSYGMYGLVRGPNKLEWVENFLLSKLPYHPQWYRSHTRFDAVLSAPLDFGTEEVSASEVAPPGTPARPDSIGQMTILATISSSDARVGDPMGGILSEPLFTPQHKLLYPQGTRFSGRITLARRARLFHRGGKLRFVIEDVQVPATETTPALSAAAYTEPVQPAHAQLAAVEADPKAVKVDSEGTATATESKTRLLRPAVAALVAVKTLDEDAGKQTASGGGTSNAGGRSLGGFSGFGFLGTIAARQGPAALGEALGFYGLAWSVYSTVVSRGNDVTFEKNAAMAIRFGNPPEHTPPKK
jgi:hypothetical protein